MPRKSKFPDMFYDHKKGFKFSSTTKTQEYTAGMPLDRKHLAH
jgi:hypothetical protein